MTGPSSSAGPDSTIVTVDLADVLPAVDFVSCVGAWDVSAYIARDTGEVISVDEETRTDDDPVPPPDLDDPTRCLPVPTRQDLDLGRRVAIDFAGEHLPSDFDTVHDLFRRKGAFDAFKALLERRGLLEQWYEHDARAEEQAVRAWCEANEFAVKDSRRPPG